MNWLAHVFLSPDNINFQIGNLLADVLKPAQLEHEDEMFRAGVQCHYEIDRFTDTHERVKEAKSLLFPKYRHYSAVLIDIFFDHFLAVNWQKFSSTGYEDYLSDFYRNLSKRTLSVCPEGDDFLNSVIQYRRLSFYHDMEGIQRALQRISARRKNKSKIDLEKSIEDLKKHYDELNASFMIFFPELLHSTGFKQ